MIEELDTVILTTDIPEKNLKIGDVGTVVLVHNEGEGYEVEFIALDGQTIAVVSVYASQIRSIRPGEIANARPIESAL